MSEPLLTRRSERLRRLGALQHDARERRALGRFVVEGPIVVGAALAAGARIEALYLEPDGPQAGELSDLADAAGVAVWWVADGELGRVLHSTTPRPVAAVAAMPDPVELDELITQAGELLVVLAGVGDPGNAGTLLRTAEAAGAGAVIFCDDGVDPYHPKTVRASAGAVFEVAVVRRRSLGEVLEQLGRLGVRRLATSARSGTSYHDADLTGPLALILGNEAHGLGPLPAPELIDAEVCIPMVGRAESLNVAMAGAVLCFESLRQRRTVSS